MDDVGTGDVGTGDGGMEDAGTRDEDTRNVSTTDVGTGDAGTSVVSTRDGGYKHWGQRMQIPRIKDSGMQVEGMEDVSTGMEDSSSRDAR